MPDWQIPFLLFALAIAVAVACAWMLEAHRLKARIAELEAAANKLTPHQKAAETRRRRHSEWVKRHIVEVESTMGVEAAK